MLSFNSFAIEGHENYTYTCYTSETIKLSLDQENKQQNDYYQIYGINILFIYK